MGDADKPAGRQEGTQHAGRERHKEEAPPFWEWVVAAIGLVLVLASLGYLAYGALQQRAESTPQPLVEMVRVERNGPRFLVLVRVTNRGDVTAEGLVVAGELKHQGQVLERSEVEFDFLPRHSSREAGLFFARDPASLQLELSAVSYRKP